ncbi:dGTP triphosphohydrolase [Curtobacterium sp. MCLR17_040]|uniref:dGTP triphosphohydrolase n=1 Tax=Curtobacterium sp. MCLR17_040 TaxID=2175625 RepID=UPI0015E87CD5|nr:dNTP triphosphohydrolase [Curtobacterium sp. MCLR17_040]
MRDRNARQHDKDERAAELWRTPAQTDADRVWYSPEFRRLEGVTQVVPPQEDYVFHDRLTHSVKVAQVAATLARFALWQAKYDEPTRMDLDGLKIEEWIDPDYCYVAGLAHDIGHPPFGHAGESALQILTEEVGGKTKERSFEGNAQSTRIVANLSFRKPQHDGLNLTLRSLAAIAKYPWERGGHPRHIDKLKKKWSFYPEEREVLDALESAGFVRTVSGKTPADAAGEPVVEAVYRWPEAEIMDWADDISYAVHDLEDFYRSGRIPLHRLTTALSAAPKVFADTDGWLTTSFDFAGDDEEVKGALRFARGKMLKILDEDGQSLAARVPAAFAQLNAVIVNKMPTNRFDGSRSAHIDLQKFASETISYLSSRTSVKAIDVEGDPRVMFRVDAEARLVAEFFKAINHYYVIESSALATMQFGQTSGLRRTVDALLKMAVAWLDDGGSQRTLPARLGEYLKASAETLQGMDETEQRGAITVAIVDYLCGLRDLQATILDSRLSGDRSSLTFSGSWLDA